jgi:ubiquinone/menaquinone biosynthesis C-methylase UbiE
MDTSHPTHNEQSALWNGHSGRAWVESQKVLDQMFKPFEDLLMKAVRAGSRQRVLDVGCGTGSTTLAVARRLGPEGHCLGVDISEPMMAAARARATQEGTATARFVCADAQTHPFEPASVDVVISRFGVMFFDDPVLAFKRLRHAAADGAELTLIAWRSAAENPFMTTAERAAAPLLPRLPARRPGAPGQFAFADQHRVRHILEESGWADIDIQPIDVACTLPEQELTGYFTRLGPVGLALQEADERTRTHVIELVRTAFDPYVRGAEVRFTAACWRVCARALAASTAPRDVDGV